MRKDWIEVEFNDVLEIVSGKNQKQVVLDNGKYPVYGSGGIIGRAKKYLCEEGTTVIGRKGTINSPIFVKQKFWNVDTAFGLSPFSILNKKLLFFFAVYFNFKKLDKSTTIPSLAKRDLLKIDFPLAPIPEQSAIVAKIEELFSDLDKGIADLKKAQDQLKVYRQAVLKKAFEGELTKEWREQNRFTKDDWKFPPLGEILIQSKEKHKPENLENLFYVGLEHIGKETGKLTETVGVSEIKTVKNKFKTGQILYGKLRPYLNKVYLAKESGVCSTDILVFNLEDSIIGKFAVQFMLSRQFVNDMSANTNGVNLPRVSTKYVNNYKFPLPPTKEQHQIIQEIESRLSVCDKVEQSISESLEKAKALRQSILKKAFEGELLSEEEIAACKAAPDYEPASVLLEKIKAEKRK